MSAADRLVEIQARADAATDGPWSFVADTRLTDTTSQWRIGSVAACADVASVTRFGDDHDDAEFIAHARADVPALVDALRAVLDYAEHHNALGWAEWPGDVIHIIEDALGEAS